MEKNLLQHFINSNDNKIHSLLQINDFHTFETLFLVMPLMHQSQESPSQFAYFQAQRTDQEKHPQLQKVGSNSLPLQTSLKSM